MSIVDCRLNDAHPAGKAKTRAGTLLNRAAVRRFALEYARSIGRGPVVQRVGGTVYAALEAAIESKIRSLVEGHPSAFRTLEAFTK